MQGYDCDDKGASSMAKFCDKIGGDKDDANMFSKHHDISYPESEKWNFELFS